MKFSVGDVVMLNSGGPLMTVTVVYDENDCECFWFYDDNKMHNHGSFVMKTLTLHP